MSRYILFPIFKVKSIEIIEGWHTSSYISIHLGVSLCNILGFLDIIQKRNSEVTY